MLYPDGEDVLFIQHAMLRRERSNILDHTGQCSRCIFQHTRQFWNIFVMPLRIVLDDKLRKRLEALLEKCALRLEALLEKCDIRFIQRGQNSTNNQRVDKEKE